MTKLFDPVFDEITRRAEQMILSHERQFGVRTISEAIARMLEFDQELSYRVALDSPDSSDDYYYCEGTFVAGAEWERARTASIDQLWPEVVEALELSKSEWETIAEGYKHLTAWQKLNAVLAKLSKAVGAE